MSEKNYSITFIIPTLNSARYLGACLAAIKKQKYPADLIEILVVDGGSKDETLQIAEQYGARVVANKKILCEPGVALGMREARGELCAIMGADNELASDTWITEMIEPFHDPHIIAAFPKLINKTTDTWLTKYVNAFTDPFNHFVYGYANNPTTFGKFYHVIDRGRNYEVYDFTVSRHPILAFDQGFTIRQSYSHERPPETEYCDILPIIDMIKNKKKFAYVYTASNFHATLNGGVKQFWRKQKWAIDNGFVKKPYGFTERVKYLSLSRRFRQYLWLLYSISFVAPLVRSWYFAVKDKNRNWLWHPFISFVAGAVLWMEIIRIKILQREPLGSRQ